MKGLHSYTFLIIAIGGLNWFLVGLFSWGIGDIFGGDEKLVSRIIYILVGVSTLYEIAIHKKNCKYCSMTKKEI